MRYLNTAQVEYLLYFASLSTLFKSDAVARFITVRSQLEKMHPEDAEKQFYLDGEECAVCLPGGVVLFKFDPTNVDLVELNYAGKGSEL